MSQHDFNIANQTFPSFRSDLNDALQAAATISAGSTGPSTPYAYQLWYDTSQSKYMLRNASNTAWADAPFGSPGIDDNSTATTITIDSNNLVGIGETVPTSALHVKGGAGANIAIQSTAGSHWRIGDAVGASNGTFVIRDHTNSANRMTIDSTGKVRINRASGLFTEQLLVESDTTSVNPMTINNSRSTSSTDYSIIFGRAGNIVGSVQTTLSATSYVTSSDYRLKTAVTYDWDATTRLKQLRPARFEWIADGDDAVPVDGFLAHEVQDIVPEAITGTKDAVDDEGNPIYQGIDQSKLVPLLVKTIQELEARITALETA